jgi:hypothetical protein
MKVTSKVEQWRTFGQKAAQAEAQELELPSGMVVRARRPGPVLLAQYARLPLTLAAKVSDESPNAVDGSAGELLNFAEFLREILVYCVVEPGISMNPEVGQIHPHEIPNGDFEFIIGWALRREEAASLEFFRH